VEVARAQVQQAKAQIKAARVERSKYRGQGSMEEKWLYQINNYQVEAAKIGLRVAKAALSSAEKTLEELKEIRDNPLLTQSQVHLAQGGYDVAVAGVAAAAARLTELEAGAREEEIAIAKALVSQAEAAVATIDAQIDKVILRAPIDGVVTSRSAHRGEAVTPGATVLTIANLDEVKLTVYVPEDKLALVFLGQDVAVEVDSFPERRFEGFVSHIAQQAEFTPKNVQTEEERVNMVFAVKIRLPNPDHLLKPGMPADARLGLE
jgi:multidrug resistance efflux pump